MAQDLTHSGGRIVTVDGDAVSLGVSGDSARFRARLMLPNASQLGNGADEFQCDIINNETDGESSYGNTRRNTFNYLLGPMTLAASQGVGMVLHVPRFTSGTLELREFGLHMSNVTGTQKKSVYGWANPLTLTSLQEVAQSGFTYDDFPAGVGADISLSSGLLVTAAGGEFFVTAQLSFRAYDLAYNP